MGFTQIRNAHDAVGLIAFALVTGGGLVALATAASEAWFAGGDTWVLLTGASGLLLLAAGLLAWGESRLLAGLAGIVGGLLATPSATAAAVLGLPGAVLTLAVLQLEREAEKPAELPPHIRPEGPATRSNA